MEMKGGQKKRFHSSSPFCIPVTCFSQASLEKHIRNYWDKTVVVTKAPPAAKKKKAVKKADDEEEEAGAGEEGGEDDEGAPKKKAKTAPAKKAKAESKAPKSTRN